MNLIIHSKNIEITDALKGYIEEKIGRIEKLFKDEDIQVHIKLSTYKHKHSFEVTIPFRDITIRAEEITEDMYKSIDIVEEKLKRKIRKVKVKYNKRFKGIMDTQTDNEVEEGDKIVRIKRFGLKPMSKEEAILQMNLLDHNFFVFYNADTEEMNVVYKRNKGEYGLIEASAIL